MRILVLAQTPPPTHGQSLMVGALVAGLPRHGIEVVHVQMRLSREHKDIGRVRLGKVFSTVRAALRARRLLRTEKFDALYYVPAPAKRAAIYRDILAMALCRTARTKLVLHWHALGLGAWFREPPFSWEKQLAMGALGGADLSIVLSQDLVGDAEAFAPKRTAVVANGIPEPEPPPPGGDGHPFNIVFIGLGTREKGLFDLAEAVSILNQKQARFRLTAAGGFGSDEDEREFRRLAAPQEGRVRHVGFADDKMKRELLSDADVFCLPTQYPHEGQPLTLIEAMAYDLRIVTTRWRGIPGMLPKENVWYTKPARPEILADAIRQAAEAPPPNGTMRSHFESRFTIERHLENLAGALASVASQ